VRPTPLGEAIRLLAFARGLARVRMENGITAANWQSLGRLGSCETADDPRARVSGELLFLGAWGPRLRPWVADELVPDPARPWPPAVSPEELLALHDKTWERLGLLCQDDADVTGLVEELNAGPSACRISYERRPLTRRGPFTVADAPDAVSLAGHLDDLLVRTAPLWHQFFACAYCSWPDVERKPSRARERFDADQCREHFRVPRQNATRRRASEGRKAQLARERAEFERLFRDGQARGVPDAYEYARQKLGKTAREVAKLWKGVAPQGSSTGLRGGAGLAIALTPSWLLRYA